MKLHEREEIVRKAEADFLAKMLDWMQEWGDQLTDGEELRVVGGLLGGHLTTMAKYQIREERHGDEDTPGGLEKERGGCDRRETESTSTSMGNYERDYPISVVGEGV